MPKGNKAAYPGGKKAKSHRSGKSGTGKKRGRGSKSKGY